MRIHDRLHLTDGIAITTNVPTSTIVFSLLMMEVYLETIFTRQLTSFQSNNILSPIVFANKSSNFCCQRVLTKHTIANIPFSITQHLPIINIRREIILIQHFALWRSNLQVLKLRTILPSTQTNAT